MTYCESCWVGQYRPGRATHVCWIDEQIVVTPNAPALICDVCGKTDFDPEFLRTVRLLIERSAHREKHNPVGRRQRPASGSPKWHRRST